MRFDVAGAMVVEDRLQTSLGQHRASHSFRARGELPPLGEAQAVCFRDSARALGSVGDRAVFIGQHQIRRRLGGDGGQQVSDLDGARDAISESRGLFEGDRDKGAEHNQAAPGQLAAQHRWIGGHVAPIAELGARIAGFGKFIEHAPVADLLPTSPFKFECAPGTRGISNQKLNHISFS